MQGGSPTAASSSQPQELQEESQDNPSLAEDSARLSLSLPPQRKQSEMSPQASLRIPPQPLLSHGKSMASISINHTGGKLIRSLNKVNMVVCL